MRTNIIAVDATNISARNIVEFMGQSCVLLRLQYCGNRYVWHEDCCRILYKKYLFDQACCVNETPLCEM